MIGRNYVFLTLGLFSILTLSMIVLPADALRSEGTQVATINSKQVCGDSLCSYPMSISEKIDMFFENNMPVDDTMFFQQGISSVAPQAKMMESDFTSNSKYVSDKNNLMQISKIFTMNNKIDSNMMKSKQSISSFSTQMSKVLDMKKSFNVKLKINFSNMKHDGSSLGSQKISMSSDVKKAIEQKSITSKELTSKSGKILKLDLDKKINPDTKNLKLVPRDLPAKNIQSPTQKSTDSKYQETIEKLKEKKLKIEKSK